MKHVRSRLEFTRVSRVDEVGEASIPPVDWQELGPGRYGFFLMGDEYAVNIDPVWGRDDEVSVDFSANDDKHGLTNKGRPLLVMSTVVSILRHHLESEPRIRVLHFVPSQADPFGLEEDDRRLRLYLAYIRKNLPVYRIQVEEVGYYKSVKVTLRPRQTSESSVGPLLEGQTTDLVQDYRELYEAGLIGALDYYRDLMQAGEDFRECRLVSPKREVFRFAGLPDDTEEHLNDWLLETGWSVAAFGFRQVDRSQTYDLQVVLSNGDYLELWWDDREESTLMASLNFKRIGDLDLEEGDIMLRKRFRELGVRVEQRSEFLANLVFYSMFHFFQTPA